MPLSEAVGVKANPRKEARRQEQNGPWTLDVLLWGCLSWLRPHGGDIGFALSTAALKHNNYHRAEGVLREGPLGRIQEAWGQCSTQQCARGYRGKKTWRPNA